MINFPSLRLNNSNQFVDTSSIRIGLKFVLMDLSSDFMFSISRLDLRVWCELSSHTGLSVLVCVCVRKRTELATNFHHESDKLCLRFAGSSRS